MKFKFTTTPLKDIPLGTVVDGYKIIQRSWTGDNAVGHRVDADGLPAKPFEAVLLLYTDQQPIEAKTS